MTELADRLRELAEGAAGEVRPPGADLARRRGRRRRRRLVAGVALAIVFAVALVGQGRLADWAAPAPPVAPGPGGGDEVPWVDPSSLRLPGVPDVGHGSLPGGAGWRLQAGRYELPNPDGTRDLVGNLVVAVQGRPKASAMRTFEEPIQLAVDTSLTDNQAPGLPVRPVFGAASPSAARVVVIPKRGGTVLAPVQAELLAPTPGIPARVWVAALPAGGTATLAVHQVRSYDAGGRELCRLDPDKLTSSCTG
jgi:hypothetical protein